MFVLHLFFDLVFEFFHGVCMIAKSGKGRNAACPQKHFDVLYRYMKRNRLQAFFAVLSVIGMAFFAVSAVLAAPEQNRPPQAQPMRAQLFAPVTHFSVVAMDPDNDPLMFSWQGDISCGTFNAGTGP